MVDTFFSLILKLDISLGLTFIKGQDNFIKDNWESETEIQECV